MSIDCELCAGKGRGGGFYDAFDCKQCNGLGLDRCKVSYELQQLRAELSELRSSLRLLLACGNEADPNAG